MTDTSTSDWADRIDRLESRQAIADLIHTYAKYIRADQPEKIASLFTPDATFEVRNGHPDKDESEQVSLDVGHEGINNKMAPMTGGAHPVPLIRNLIVELDGDKATANSVMDAKIYGTPHGIVGEYRDTCRRVDGRWLFASRSFTMYKNAQM
jgi:hypothetical protein